MKLTRKIFIIVLILGTIRLILPFAALAAINYTFRNQIEDYVGHVDDLHLAILRGAVEFKNLHLEKRDKPESLQANVESIKFNLSWRELWNKKAIAEMYINKVEVVLTEIPKLKPPKPEDLTFKKIRKILAESKWSSEINKFEVRNSSVQFLVSEAKAPLSVSNINVAVYNLHFSPDKEWQLSDFTINGLLQGQGEINLSGKLQPLALPPMADVNFSLIDFDLKTLNGLLLKIVPLDITRGKLSAYIETATEKGYSKGYTKIFFDEIDVVASPQKFKSGRHFLIEAGAALGNWVLKNDKEKSLAVNLPFEIKHDSVAVNTSEAFWSTVENKRDELDRKLDNSVSLAQNRNENP